jgi:hypothetical protein
MKFSKNSKDIMNLEILEKEYIQGFFMRISWSEEEILLYLEEKSIIDMNSLRSRELMKGYRISMGKIKINK